MDNKINIRKLGSNDILLFQKLILLFQEAFEMDVHTIPEAPYLKKLLETPDFIALAIMYEDEIVGGLTAYELRLYYAEYSEIYIYDIGIKPEFQRRGFGKKLLFALKEHCRENKISTFFVEALEEDKNAVDFYRSAGGKAEKVVHFNFEV